MRNSVLSILLHAALAFCALTAPRMAVASPSIVELLEALIAFLADPAPCASDPTCERAYLAAAKKLQGALQALGTAGVPKTLGQVASGVAVLEKAGVVEGALDDRVQTLVDAVHDAVMEEVAGTESLLDGLCTSVRCGVEKKLAKPAAQLQLAQEQRDGRQWSSALKSYARAMAAYASAGAQSLRAGARCHPRACSSSAFVHFTPGPGSESLTLLPPDTGTTACFELESEETGGTVCFSYEKIGSSRFSLDLDDLDEPVTGSAQVATCTDSEGWVRFQKIGFSVAAGELGRGRLSFSATPPAVSFFGGLLPAPPQALGLRVGDRMEEPSLSVSGKLGRLNLTVQCDVVHEVLSIQEVTVIAGVFRAARIHTSGTCGTTVDDEEIEADLEADTWVASQVGQVLIEARMDGDLQARYELSSFDLPAECS